MHEMRDEMQSIWLVDIVVHQYCSALFLVSREIRYIMGTR